MQELSAIVSALPQLQEVAGRTPGFDVTQGEMIEKKCKNNFGEQVNRWWFQCPLLGFPRSRVPVGDYLAADRCVNWRDAQGQAGWFYHGSQASHLVSIAAEQGLKNATETASGAIGAYAADEFALAEAYAYPERLGAMNRRIQCVLCGRSWHMKRSGHNEHSYVIQRVVIDFSELTHVLFAIWPDDPALCYDRCF